MKINRWIAAAWLILTVASCFSCSDQETVAPTDIRLSASVVEFNWLGLTDEGQYPSVTVHANKYWTIRFSSEAEWLEVSPIAGAKETEITFYGTTNTTGAERSVSLILESLDGTTAELLVKQGDESEPIYHLQENMGTESVSEQNLLTYDQWQKKGIGSIVTKYVGSKTTVDSGSPSAGYEGASGGNNILFPPEESDFSWGKVDIRDSVSFLRLSFGLMSTGDFDPATFKLYVSQDNSLWVEAPYSRSSEPGWALVESTFKVVETPELYFKVVSTGQAAYRLDDIALIDDETQSGDELVFEEVDPIPVASFAFNGTDWEYFQNFDLLVWKDDADFYKHKNYAEGAYWIKGETLPGWYLSRAIGVNAGTFRIDNGGSYTAASFMSYGYLTQSNKPNVGKTDEECLNRCLGSVTNTASGAVTMMGVVIKNTTGSLIRSLDISYSGHLWKGPNNTFNRAEKLEFSYAVNPVIALSGENLNNTDIMDDVVPGTPYPALDFVRPDPNEATGVKNYGKMDGRDAQNMAEITATLTVIVPPKGTILLRWKDQAQAEESHNYGKAIDDLRVVARF